MAFFLMRCLHHPDIDDLRNEHRPRHREWVRSGGNGLVSVLIGSALLDEAGQSQGNFGILEARNREDARAFTEGDPFAQAGIVREIDLVPLPGSFQAQRITDPMSTRLPAESEDRDSERRNWPLSR